MIERQKSADLDVQREWLTTPQAAHYLSISPQALRTAVYRGQIKSYKLGRRLRFRLGELRQLILESRSPSRPY